MLILFQASGSGSFTPSSASSVSIPISPPGKLSIRICPYHNGFPLNLFCQKCDTAICSDCNHTSHRNHKTIPLIQKSKDLVEGLTSVLVTSHEQRKEIERRSSILDKCNQDIEDTTNIAIQQMDEQCKHIIAEIRSVYNGQVDKAKREEQSRFEAEKSQLQNLNKLRKDLEETSRHYLEQTTSSDFISRANTFLT